jgi:tetratricopeptide (TPR) repeat protein
VDRSAITRLTCESLSRLLSGLAVICFSQASLTKPAFSQDACFALIKGPIAFDVEFCKPFDPGMFDTSKPKYKFIDDLDTQGRKELLDSYRGLVVRGTVVMSRAIKSGVSTTKGVLKGEKTVFFIPPQVASCEDIFHKRVSGSVEEVCCNGTGNAPCLLDSGLVFKDLKIAGDAMVGETIVKKGKRIHGKDYLEAEKLYSQKKYKEAVKFYTKAEESNDIDVKGLFRMGFAYRELEKCDLAIRPLKKIWDLQQASKIWAEEELDARRGIFLLARCHAKNGDPSGAVFYLNGFLLDSKKYRSELRQSLKHKDFGWIHTSKEYRQYRQSAEKKLGSPSRTSSSPDL